jgi:hypothetical protein
MKVMEESYCCVVQAHSVSIEAQVEALETNEVALRALRNPTFAHWRMQKKGVAFLAHLSISRSD